MDRTVIDVDALEWLDQGGRGTKLLRMNDDFSYIDVIWAPSGFVAPAHIHLGVFEILYLEGEVETAGGVAGKGHFERVPAGALHRASKTFVGERTLSDLRAFNHIYGPLVWLNEDGDMPPVRFGQDLSAQAKRAANHVTGRPEINEIYREDYESGVVKIDDLEWMPSPYDGVSMKIMSSEDSGRFVVLLKGEDCAVIPPRHYSAPADFYVLSGCLKFADQDASTDHWVYEPLGMNEAAVRHEGETIYLATFFGAALDLSADGSIERAFDARTVRELSASAVSATH